MKLSDRLDRMVPPIQGLHELDHFIEQLITPRKNGSRVLVPRADIVEHSTGFTLSIEVPGIAPDAISVEVADERLTVSGEKKPIEVDETSTVHRRERVTGSFERHFEFPVPVDLDKISATSSHGVLVIEVPKAEKVLPRKIEIAVK